MGKKQLGTSVIRSSHHASVVLFCVLGSAATLTSCSPAGSGGRVSANLDHGIEDVRPKRSGYPPMPFVLGAVATRKTQISLYWGPYPGASGYNVYRGTSHGHEIGPINSAPYDGRDPNPGVTAFLYNDPNLKTGRAYYYVVKAVVRGKEVAVSNESSDVPNSSAIPFDTNDPERIVSRKLASNILSVEEQARAAGSRGSKFAPLPPPVIVVQAPDGMSYTNARDKNGNWVPPYPPTTWYDFKTHLFHEADGSVHP